ncbi:hypothetical protein AOLI_G00015530 [Acnodon oligacanthus]
MRSQTGLLVVLESYCATSSYANLTPSCCQVLSDGIPRMCRERGTRPEALQHFFSGPVCFRRSNGWKLKRQTRGSSCASRLQTEQYDYECQAASLPGQAL